MRAVYHVVQLNPDSMTASRDHAAVIISAQHDSSDPLVNGVGGLGLLGARSHVHNYAVALSRCDSGRRDLGVGLFRQTYLDRVSALRAFRKDCLEPLDRDWTRTVRLRRKYDLSDQRQHDVVLDMPAALAALQPQHGLGVLAHAGRKLPIQSVSLQLGQKLGFPQVAGQVRAYQTPHFQVDFSRAIRCHNHLQHAENIMTAALWR